MRRIKRINKNTQGTEFIDLNIDNEDEERTTKMLLLDKDAQIKEWEKDFERVQCIIQYYKNEHKYFKNIKRGLSLQNKMTKHYTKKSRFAYAKLKEAFLEVKKIKRENEHKSLGILAEASQKLSKNI